MIRLKVSFYRKKEIDHLNPVLQRKSAYGRTRLQFFSVWYSFGYAALAHARGYHAPRGWSKVFDKVSQGYGHFIEQAPPVTTSLLSEQACCRIPWAIGAVK